MTEKRTFSLVLKQEAVTLVGEDGPKDYWVRELSGEGRNTYMAKLTSKMTLGKDGKPTGVTNLSGMETGLLALTLFTFEGELVKLVKIKKYPSSVVEELSDMSMLLSGLSKKDEDEEGKD